MLADQQQVILKGVLEEPIDNDNNDNEATIKAKTFYKSCMDLRKLSTKFSPFSINSLSSTKVSKKVVQSISSSHAEQIRKIGDQPLRDVVKTLGGWPVIEPNWKPPNMSIEILMGQLRGEYSEPVLLEIYVGADDKNSSINILQVRDCSKTSCSISNYFSGVLLFIVGGSVSIGFAFKRLLSQSQQRR